MNTAVVIMILLCAVVLFGIVNALFLKRNPLKTGFLYVLCGVASLFLVNLVSPYTGINLPISCWSLIISGVGGIPGTILLCVMQFIIV